MAPIVSKSIYFHLLSLIDTIPRKFVGAARLEENTGKVVNSAKFACDFPRFHGEFIGNSSLPVLLGDP
jgi:hypothetical protein